MYNLAKHGVGFSESLPQEFASLRRRVSLVDPGAVITGRTDHLRPEQKEASRERFKASSASPPTTSSTSSPASR